MIDGFFNKISDLFGSSNDESSMSFYRLYTNMRKWNQSGAYPPEYELPDTILFPADFWRRVVELYKYTKYDEHERAVSVFWADGDVVTSSVVKGGRSSVTPKNDLLIRYVPSRHKDYYSKEVLLDGKIYSKKDVYYKKIPKKIEAHYLFNMHTHPPHGDKNSPYYSFFSLQDLKSLLASNAVITGMIGDKLWILIRTNKTPSVLNNFEEHEISVESLTSRLHLGVYCGEFNKKLSRLGPQLVTNNSTITYEDYQG